MNFKRLSKAFRDKGLPNLAQKLAVTALSATHAGPVIDLIADVAGQDTEDPDVLAAAIEAASPKQLVELRRIDADLELGMAKQETERLMNARQDREDARSHERLDSARFWMAGATFLTVILGCGGLVLAVAFLGGENGEISEVELMVVTSIGTIVAGLGTKIGSIIDYLYGSSSGSTTKERSAFSRMKGL